MQGFKITTATEESRFLKPSFFSNLPITQPKSHFPSSVKHCNFTPNFSNCPIFRTNFPFYWKFEKSGFHCIFGMIIVSFRRENCEHFCFYCNLSVFVQHSCLSFLALCIFWGAIRALLPKSEGACTPMITILPTSCNTITTENLQIGLCQGPAADIQ